MNKEDIIYIKNGVLFGNKKNEIMPFATIWMQLEIIMLSKSKRERQMLYDITYMWNLRYDMNEHIYKTETDSWT